jgi:GTP-binding protein YchF
MKIGIIGLPQSGKTALFSALAGGQVKKGEPTHQKFITHLTTMKLEDERLQHLGQVFSSKKVTFAEILLLDLLLRGETDKEWFVAVSFHEADCLAGVLRCFINPLVPVWGDKIDAVRDMGIIESELIIRDLQAVESRTNKIEQDIKKGRREDEKELGILKKVKQHLDRGLPLRSFEMELQEEKLLRGFKFLSQKPVFWVLNLDEQMAFEGVDTVKENLAGRDCKFILASLKIEAELNELEEKEQFAFLDTLGFKEPLRNRFLSACLSFLERITFFTVKGEEARAWLVDKNTTALEAAGKIHSDMERGFIRAEVVNYNDFISVGSSVAEAKKKGLVRLESKEYSVRDGDIIDFRFAV